jgi:epoxyqueuosine reductase
VAGQVVAEAHRLGFDLVGIAPAVAPATADQYRAWLEEGYQGEMGYLARPDAVAKRSDLTLVLPGVRSVVVVGTNYYTVPLPPGLEDEPSRGILASYAWGRDYHDLLLPRLNQLAASLKAIIGPGNGTAIAHRAYVDTGPILERELGARAGLGFVGKNTNLIHPRLGSWFFLGELLLPFDLTAEAASSDGASSSEGAGSSEGTGGTCGRCTRCLDACPTGAFVAPYHLDARRCISYLTIELKGPIPQELRPLMGNRIFGCDICQEVCPWNRRFAQRSAEAAFQPWPGAIGPRLLDLMALDDEGFGRRFRGSPIKRAKRRGLLRNVAVALGNWGSPSAIPALARALHDVEPLIRGHAAWAMGRIGGSRAMATLEQALTIEIDTWVRAELRHALGKDFPAGKDVV